MSKKNTLKSGAVRYVVFKEAGSWYAAALEFNIVESGDDPREVLMLLLEAVEGYVASARKAKLRPGVLNQTPDSEYERLWEIGQGTRRKPVKSPIQVHTSGISSLQLA